MLHAEPALLLPICYMYAQDSACLSAQYEPPEACKQLLFA